jgi:hypothetical protein
MSQFPQPAPQLGVNDGPIEIPRRMQPGREPGLGYKLTVGLLVMTLVVAAAWLIVRLAGPLNSSTSKGEGEARSITADPGDLAPCVTTGPPTAPPVAPSTTAFPPGNVPYPTTTAPSGPNGPIQLTGPGRFGYADRAYLEGPMTPQADRRTAAGITLRVHRLNGYGTPTFPARPDGWTPQPWCFPSGALRVSVSSSKVVGLANSDWYDSPKDGVMITTFAVGGVESAPIFGVVMQVDATVTSVRFTHANGRSDVAKPTNGVAVLAVAGDITRDFTVKLTRRNGTTDVAQPSTMGILGNNPASPYDCSSPPPTLPTAGAAPANSATIDAGLRDRWAARSSMELATPAWGADVVDAQQLIDAINKAQTFAPSQSQPFTYLIDKLVFTSPTEAWFSYTGTVQGQPLWGHHFGQAIQSGDGRWRFSQRSVCQDLGVLYATFAPDLRCDPLLPPGYEGVYPIGPTPPGTIPPAPPPPPPVVPLPPPTTRAAIAAPPGP